jgi:uncharacterized protein
MEDKEIIEYPINNKVFIGKSDVHFRGVIASQPVKIGEIIERCPLVPLSNRSRYQYDPTVWNYMYGHTNCDCKECKNHGFVFYMVLGYGMIYNHKDEPNASWVFHYDHFYADLIASKDIEKEEEIFVSYGDKYWENREKYNAKNS